MTSYHIVGAGGIGCAVGYALRAAGCTVGFVDTDLEKIAWGQAHGVAVEGRPVLPAEFIAFDDWRPAAGDTILLCTKCYDNDAVLARLPGGVMVVPIQNGFDRRLAALGAHPEGIASFVSECTPGRTHTCITRDGKLHLGSGGTAGGAVRELAENLQKAGLFHVEVVDDILPYKHTKLLYNAAIGPLAAAAGLDNGKLLSVPRARRLFFALLRENYAILHGAGIPLARIGPFHPDTVSKILRVRVVARALAYAFEPSLRGTYCSMHGDLPTGRTEIDFYNRYLIDVAADRPCPLNRQVYALVKRLEGERARPELGRLEELIA